MKSFFDKIKFFLGILVIIGLGQSIIKFGLYIEEKFGQAVFWIAFCVLILISISLMIYSYRSFKKNNNK